MSCSTTGWNFLWVFKHNFRVRGNLYRREMKLCPHYTLYCLFPYSYNADTDHCHVPHQTDAIASVTNFFFTGILGYHSYVFVTPPQYDSIDGRSSSESNIIYWKSSVDNEDNNVDTTGVSSYQRCYELCQIVNEGFCWVFRWVWRHTAQTDCHDL